MPPPPPGEVYANVTSTPCCLIRLFSAWIYQKSSIYPFSKPASSDLGGAGASPSIHWKRNLSFKAKKAFRTVLQLPLLVQPQTHTMVSKHNINKTYSCVLTHPQNPLKNQKQEATLDWLFSHLLIPEVNFDLHLYIHELPISTNSLIRWSWIGNLQLFIHLYILFLRLQYVALTNSDFINSNLQYRDSV